MKNLLRVSKPGFDLFQCKRDLIFIDYTLNHFNTARISIIRNQPKSAIKVSVGKQFHDLMLPITEITKRVPGWIGVLRVLTSPPFFAKLYEREEQEMSCLRVNSLYT